MYVCLVWFFLVWFNLVYRAVLQAINAQCMCPVSIVVSGCDHVIALAHILSLSLPPSLPLSLSLSLSLPLGKCSDNGATDGFLSLSLLSLSLPPPLPLSLLVEKAVLAAQLMSSHITCILLLI